MGPIMKIQSLQQSRNHGELWRFVWLSNMQSDIFFYRMVPFDLLCAAYTENESSVLGYVKIESIKFDRITLKVSKKYAFWLRVLKFHPLRERDERNLKVFCPLRIAISDLNIFPF